MDIREIRCIGVDVTWGNVWQRADGQVTYADNIRQAWARPESMWWPIDVYEQGHGKIRRLKRF